MWAQERLQLCSQTAQRMMSMLALQLLPVMSRGRWMVSMPVCSRVMAPQLIPLWVVAPQLIQQMLQPQQPPRPSQLQPRQQRCCVLHPAQKMRRRLRHLQMLAQMQRLCRQTAIRAPLVLPLVLRQWRQVR